MQKIITLLSLIICSTMAYADVKLPVLFGNNMVLQRDKPLRIWGQAAAGEKVVVQLNQQTQTTRAGKNGAWQLFLQPEKAGGPFQLVVQGRNKLVINNILVGEVWICSGQSNMEMPINGWGKINNYEKEISAADYPGIRQFDVPNSISIQPENDLKGGDWKICHPSTAGEFSATAYFFAREIYKQLGVPVGLVNTTWGGTQSEAWTSQKAFAQSDLFKPIAAAMQTGDIKTIIQQREEAMINRIKKWQGSFNETISAQDWKNTNYDDSQWPTMELPGLWEDKGLNGLDGVVWFRKTIQLTEEEAAQVAVLELGKIDDNDETYINGIKAGSTSQWDAIRNYTVPNGVLRAGKNVIAVKVVDDGGGGGLYGDEDALQLKLGPQRKAISGKWMFRVASIKGMGDGNSIGPNEYPSLLFNAMIHPLLPLSIRGAIWYQGESNAGRAYEYRTAFPLMINDWRQHWQQGEFPFLFAQLSSYGSANANSNSGSNWAELREAQALTLSLPNTGMAVTTDIGDANDIHPKNKQDVGKRLAAIALHHVYGQPGEYTGPVYQSMKAEARWITLSFTHVGSGWRVKDKYGYIKGFEIAGTDKQFHFAQAMIKNDQLVVWCDEVILPVAVRYNWADDAGEGNVFNKEGFPLAPFRTDDWPGVTEKNKYSIN